MHKLRVRVICIYKSLYLSLGALGQDIIKLIKIINRLTHFINELLYTHFVTLVGLPSRLTIDLAASWL